MLHLEGARILQGSKKKNQNNLAQLFVSIISLDSSTQHCICLVVNGDNDPQNGGIQKVLLL